MKQFSNSTPLALIASLFLSATFGSSYLQAEKAPEETAEQPAATEEAKTDEAEKAEAKDPEVEAAKAEVERIKQEIARLTAEKDKIEAERALGTARRIQEQAEMLEAMEDQKRIIEALKAEIELAEAEARAGVREELTELTIASQLATVRATAAKADAELKAAELKLVEADFRHQISELTLAIELQQKQRESRDFALSSPMYLEDPVVEGRLVISDRRISMNGPITSRTADHVAERINYFNNRDRELPIFIVIDDSPGGSVMAGYKILKAMEGSPAPVYVVVKSFAASMAACITTLAERSFAYPNALILHHQISSGLFGNLTMQQERVQELQEWWRRLAGPIADKMGITKDEFIAMMYKNASTGDWQEFGDKAVELKWVDQIISEIEETSLLEHPDRRNNAAAATTRVTLAEIEAANDPSLPAAMTDDKGNPFMLLPRINPLDVYWIYNPDGYYRGR